MTKKNKRTSVVIDKRKSREQLVLLEQLRKMPIVSIACEKTGIARATYYRWKKDDSVFAAKADQYLQEGVLLMNDMAESQLLSAIRDGDMTAIMFWLRSRHGAFGNKVEMRATVEHMDRNLTPDERAMIRKALKLGGFT